MSLTNTRTGGYEATKTHEHRAPANWSIDSTEAPTKQDIYQGRRRPAETPINQGTDLPRHSLRKEPTEEDVD